MKIGNINIISNITKVLATCLALSIYAQALMASEPLGESPLQESIVEAENNCLQSTAKISNEIEEFKEHLISTKNVSEFRELLNSRYDDISGMLEKLESCDQITMDDNPDIQVMKGILLELRADAREMAFSEFQHWMRVRNEEIDMLEGFNGITLKAKKAQKLKKKTSH